MRFRCSSLIVVLTSAALHAQTGTAVSSLATFDQAMTSVMSQYGVAGGALAITRNGHLVFARGYGMADTASKTPVQPNSVFRLASLSKPITVAATLMLVQQGKIGLDDSAFSYLTDLKPPPGATPDPRLKSITIRELLQHSGGWDDTISPDPIFMPDAIAQALGVQAPASSDDIVRYMLGQKLDFDPGARYAYCNFGYLVLGRIIERVSGMKYEQFVRTHVLLPAGITQMRVGNTLQVGKLPNEVTYYDTFDPKKPGVFPFMNDPVSAPYGAWYLESMDSAAGWVASPIDYIRFMNSLEGRLSPKLLTADSIAAMTAHPSTWTSTAYWYGMGFHITTTPSANNYDWWTDGAFEGTYSQVIRTYDGGDLVAVFNNWPGDAAAFGAAVNKALWTAYDSIQSWPSTDQFNNYPASTAAVPSVNAQEGVVNAASYQRGIVPGSWVAIFGDTLAYTSRTWEASDFKGNNLPLVIDNVSVTVDGKPAAISYVSPRQINIQVPEGVSAGAVLVQVTNHGVNSSPVLAEVRPSAPAMFTFGPGLISAAHLNGSIVGDPSAVPGTVPARAGETIVIYGNAFADSPAGVMIPSPQATERPVITFGNQTAEVSYAGLIAPGLYQVNLVVPSLAPGAYALQGTVNGAQFLGAATLTVGK